MDSVQSEAYQKNCARTRAFARWEAQYHQERQEERMLEHARTNWLGVVNAPPRFAYTHTLVEPPFVNHHPLWREGPKRMVDSDWRKTKRPLYLYWGAHRGFIYLWVHPICVHTSTHNILYGIYTKYRLRTAR